MEPTLKAGDTIWVNNWAYFFNSVRISDVIVFKKSDQELIKRVTKISGSKIFLKGDNQADSLDSRAFGEVSKKEITGKVIL